MKSGVLVYEDLPRYEPWTKLVVGGIIAVTLVPGVILLFIDTVGAYVMLGATVFDGLLMWAILPRSFQVYDDRVRIALGGPLGINIPLADIKTIGPADRYYAFAYWGLRFVTSLASVIEITRRHGLDVVFSPSQPDIFIEQVNQARDAPGESNVR